jgi:adenosylhomocysteine nucleosidase
MKKIVVIFSADAEWRAARKCCKVTFVDSTPFGECFAIQKGERSVIYVQGGWGKIAAAASAQFAISQWNPDLVVNLGTCGGLLGAVERGSVILVERTLVYDLIEQMGDQQQALDAYTTRLDLGWLAEPYPQTVQKGLMLSADRDIVPEQVEWLRDHFGGIAADWESAAIAWVCSKNGVKCLILRAVSDLVGPEGGEAYGNIKQFQHATDVQITKLLEHLPAWIDSATL